jgi:ATP-dependent RNA helicase DHX29
VIYLNQLSSNSAFLDLKIKFSIAPKTNMALKILRARLASVLATQMRGKPLTPQQQKWSDLALLVLSKIPVELDEEEEAIARQAPSVDLIF